MAVVSLIEAQNVCCPDAWHGVNAPGGYEIWHFDAEDSSGRLRLAARFRLGSFANPGYWRHFCTYLKAPTRNAPPLPVEYPSVYFELFQEGKLAGQFFHTLSATEFLASDRSLDLKMGRHLVRAGERGVSLHLEGEAENISVDLEFQPAWAQEPIEVDYLGDAKHRWVLSNPLHEVTGQIRLPNRQIEFAGCGYRDYRYGTHPLGDSTLALFRGRAISGQRVAAFNVTENARLIVAAPGGISQQSPANISAQWRRSGLLGLKYPARLSLDDTIHLTNPRILNAQKNKLSLVYDCLMEGEPATAFCEILRPRRVPGKWFKRTGGAHG